MITRRDVMRLGAAVAVLPFVNVLASAKTPDGVVVMAKAIDDITTGFDPAEVFDFSNNEVCGNIYQSLCTVDPADSTKIIGDLAERWEVSADGTEYTFYLQKDAKFPSGNPVVAEDVAYSLRRAVKMGLGQSQYIAQFGFTADNVDQRIRTDGPDRVVLTLAQLWSSTLVLACLSTNAGGVVEKAAVEANTAGSDFGNKWLRTNSAGSGPYQLKEWEAADRVILTANPNARVHPSVSRFIVRHVAESPTQLLLVKKRDVDVARNLGADELRSINSDADISKATASVFTQFYIAMNGSTDQLKSQKITQAIKWAIDYESIANNITPGLWDNWQSFLPKGSAGAVTDNPFRRDLDRAKALMKEAGLEGGFEVTLDHYATWPAPNIAQVLQANLAEIGITVRLLAGELGQVSTKMRSRQHQLALAYWGADYVDPNMNSQAFCLNVDDSDGSATKYPAWRCHYSDEEMNKSVSAAVRELDLEKRLGIYRAIQTRFFETAPFAFLLQQRDVAAMAKGVSGYDIGPLVNVNRYAGITKS
ncbi:ABC transporter substrate-binding protein [Mesorhizobium sp. M0174]|uniref:ABC transporter substrate-binding protein n=1 Tax=Mesorhizobium sp. M0174 TaxID=2956904 RepID=UPI00333B0661